MQAQQGSSQIEQRLEISTNSNQLVTHISDSSFNLQLGQTIPYKSMKLNQFSYVNLLKNFSGSESSFDVITSDVGNIPIRLEFYMQSWSTSTNFIAWLNQQLIAGGSALQFADVSGHQPALTRILSPWDLRLAMKTNLGFTAILRGRGYQKLGFAIDSIIYNETFIGYRLPNWGQTSKIYVQIANIQSAVQSFVSCQYAIVNNSSFGGTISIIYPDDESNQLIQIFQQETVNTFQMQLYDDKGELIETCQGNNNEPTLTMNLSLYRDAQ